MLKRFQLTIIMLCALAMAGAAGALAWDKWATHMVIVQMPMTFVPVNKCADANYWDQ